jgi:phage FluMu protein Com
MRAQVVELERIAIIGWELDQRERRMPTEDYIEIRCNKDNKLLFRARSIPAGEIEIKCRRCGTTRRFSFPLAAKTGKPASPQPGHQSYSPQRQR